MISLSPYKRNERGLMSIAIAYASRHHGNTKKVVEALAAAHDLTTIDIDATAQIDLDRFDCVGFAGGVAYGRIYEDVRKLAERTFQPGKKVFFIYTCGKNSRNFAASLEALAAKRGCEVFGTFGCEAWDSFGPLKPAGGINKDRPNDQDLRQAVAFLEQHVLTKAQ